MIQFESMNLKGAYNLAFGDKNPDAGEMDDTVVSNNGDMEKVLATVVAAVYVFSNYYSDARIYITGSTQARTRLYQMGTNKYFDILNEDFYIIGECGNTWEPYKMNDKYSALAIKRKFSKFDL